MSDYHSVLAAFTNYFEALAQISGALVGLVFVALTYNDRLLGKDGHPGLRALAEQVFADFLVLLVLSLVMLIPDFAPQALSYFLMLSALLGIGRIVRSLIALLRSAQARSERSVLLQRFGLSLLGNAFFMIAGVLALNGMQDSRFWSLLVSGTMFLLISGSRSAWLLVTHARRED